MLFFVIIIFVLDFSSIQKLNTKIFHKKKHKNILKNEIFHKVMFKFGPLSNHNMFHKNSHFFHKCYFCNNNISIRLDSKTKYKNISQCLNLALYRIITCFMKIHT